MRQAQWDETRRNELIALEALLSDIKMLNKGSNVIERMHRCIDAAEKLTAHTLTNEGRQRSFLFFLNECAIAGDVISTYGPTSDAR